ncbi:MAG: DsbA family protein [Proteobacteria bacterium]|nr:DsbA family protein [Pseudomonadota bacterium]
MSKTNFLILIPIFLLLSCSESKEPESPANKQIQEYTKSLEECKDDDKTKTGSQSENKSKEHVRSFAPEPDDIVFGNKEAKVVVVEYFSPTCPHCVTYHKKIYPSIKSKFVDTGRIAYVIREFIGNKQDLDAAILARCKGDIGSYNNFIKILLEQQENWAFDKNYREIITNIGVLGGVSPEQYTACLKNDALMATLMANSKLVLKDPGFIGTPSFFINGTMYKKPYTLEDLSSAIEEADKAIANGK